ncbi:MAG: hypothetical protein IJZ39_12190 [Oscillospiraceae bacterium]|nr:hypothetical protein [Oscillospiraceae bacterium]
MATYNWTVQELQAHAARSLEFSYNTDRPDTLNIELRPESYAKLPLVALDRLTVTEGGRVIFSGIVPIGANCAAQAAQGETVNIELQSDYYILQNTVYAKLNGKGEAVFSRTPVDSRTTTLNKVVESISEWLDSYLPSRLTCSTSAVVPTPTSDGTAPCASLLADALRWVPDAVTVQRYINGGSLSVTTSANVGSIQLTPKANALQSVSLQARYDLRVPVCALVGGVHKVWPAGADIRQLGAFVYAVPVEYDDPDSPQVGGAGTSPASSKMIVKGVPIPEGAIFVKGKEEYDTDPYTAQSNAQKFIKHFFPELAPLQSVALIGKPLVEIVSRETLQEELEDSGDEDAQVPDNYMDNIQSWGLSQIYVHTEGSFPASTRNSKNVRGLRWCKAQVSFILAVKSNQDLTAEQRLICQTYLPGRRTKNGEVYGYVRKTLNCNLINRRRRVYDPATNKLCSTDEGYSEEIDTEATESPTTADYIAAMEQYYAAASKLQHEGSISMLHNGSLVPSELTGKSVTVAGLREEWESMTAVIRSVQWDYGKKSLSLSVGSRAVMGYSENLQRRVLARNRTRDEAQKNTLAYDPVDDIAQTETENAMSVSPSITAGTDTTSSGKFHKRGTLYIREEDKVLVCAGGSIRYGNQLFHIDDAETQTNGSPWEKGKPVRIKFVKDESGKTTYELFQ